MKVVAMAIWDEYEFSQKVYLYKGKSDSEILQKIAMEPDLKYCSKDIKEVSSFSELKERLEEDDIYVDIKSIEI